ncbi:protein-tyrosine phosphatase [Alkalibacillus flavidus]|uniref:protein-tyrosine-phosphatase n=1 Tax=Alkalibacillus flavidus TaxID=546021 RepID=A0ABV2KU85_9BACI
MIKVLFVCLGNICRSPMAEAVFADMVSRKGLDDQFVVDSAGTSDYHIGESPHEGTITQLKQHHINSNGMVGRQIKSDDYKYFDYIMVMDEKNLRDVISRQTGDHQPVIKKLLDYLPEEDVSDVPDPYFEGGFDYTYDLVKRACKHLLDDILTEHDVSN